MSSVLDTGWENFGVNAYTLALVSVCIIYLYLLHKRKGNLPPGPQGLPIWGNLHQLDTKDLVKSLEDLSKMYGPVFTIYLGPRPNVVLYGYKAVKEALVEQADNFSGRGEFEVVHGFTKGNGLVFSNGEKWKTLRRFALTTLRNFGMGKRGVEERIKEEAQFLMEGLKHTKRKRICVGESLARMELFIFFSTLLQNFTFQPTQQPELIDLKPTISGVGNVPTPYQLCAIPR